MESDCQLQQMRGSPEYDFAGQQGIASQSLASRVKTTPSKLCEIFPKVKIACLLLSRCSDKLPMKQGKGCFFRANERNATRPFVQRTATRRYAFGPCESDGPGLPDHLDLPLFCNSGNRWLLPRSVVGHQDIVHGFVFAFWDGCSRGPVSPPAYFSKSRGVRVSREISKQELARTSPSSSN